MKKFITAIITSGIILAPVAAFAADIVMSGSVSMDDNLSVEGGISGTRYAHSNYAHAIVDQTMDNLTWSDTTSLVLIDNSTVRLPVPLNGSNRVFTVIGSGKAVLTPPAGTTIMGTDNVSGKSVDCVELDNTTWACY